MKAAAETTEGDFDRLCLELERYAHNLCMDGKVLKRPDSDEVYLAAVLRHWYVIFTYASNPPHLPHSRLAKDVAADPSELEVWWDISIWSVLIDHCFLPIRSKMHLARREAAVASSTALQVTRKADGYCISPAVFTSHPIERFFIESAGDTTHRNEDFRKLSRMQRDSLFTRLTVGVEGEVYGIQTMGSSYIYIYIMLSFLSLMRAKGPFFYMSSADVIATDAVLVHDLEKIEMDACAGPRRLAQWLDIAHCILALRVFILCSCQC